MTPLAEEVDRLQRTGAFDEAIACARQAARETGPADAIITLATLLRRRGHTTEAVAVLRAALDHAPHSVDLWNHAALALRNNGEFPAALDAFRRAADVDPGNTWVETNMMFGLARAGDCDTTALFDASVRGGLGIFCDRYPFLYGFLHKEYASYLRHFQDADLFTFGRDVFAPYDPSQFGRHVDLVARRYPDILDRVHQIIPSLDTPGAPGAATGVSCRLAQGERRPVPRHGYCFFLMTVDLFRPLFEAWNIPFTFTLEPGGGFILNDAGSDAKLRAVLASPQFRSVIVQQPVVRDYLRDVMGLGEDRMAFIPGVMPDLAPFQAAAALPPAPPRNTVDIAFVGSLYAPGGRDKGFDLFVDAAKALADWHPAARFHVVGNFPEALADGAPITFHGRQTQTWLADFYRGIDILVAPNRPWQITHGSLDAFPVNTCVEAAAAGVAVAASDPLNNNVLLPKDAWIDITGASGARIAEALLPLLREPAALASAKHRCQAAFTTAFGDAQQAQPRLRHMEAMMSVGRTP